MSEAAKLELYEGVGAIRDRMLVVMRDLVAEGYHPAIVVVGLLTGVGTATGMLVAERAGEAPDEELATDMAVIARSSIELTASVCAAFRRDPGSELHEDEEAQDRAGDLVSAQHVVACDLRESFERKAKVAPMAHALLAMSAKGNA